jgi:glycerophosphoryl diester phosphodiesterase
VSELDYQRIVYWKNSAERGSTFCSEKLQRTLRSDVYGVALDINFSKDEQPVVVSDSTLGRQRFGDVTHLELQEYRIPTLDEIISIWPKDVVVIANLKEIDGDNSLFLKKVLDVLQKTDISAVVGSDSPDVVDQIRGYTQEVIGIAEDIETMRQYMKWNLPLVALDKPLATRQNIQKLLNEDIDVWAWNMDEHLDVQSFVWMGVSGICMGEFQDEN